MASPEQVDLNAETYKPDPTLEFVCNAINWVLTDPSNAQRLGDEGSAYTLERGVRFIPEMEHSSGSYVGTGKITYMANGDRLQEDHRGVAVHNYDRSLWPDSIDPSNPDHPLKDWVPVKPGTDDEVDVERLRQRGPDVIARMAHTIVITLKRTGHDEISRTF